MERRGDYLIIIPAYNEEDTIEEVTRRTKRYADVCVVNDCSTDATPEILSRIEDINVIHHKRNTHFAGATLDGMEYAVEKGYKYAITIDAGLSHNPDEIPLFVNYGDADLIIGARIKKINTPLFRRLLSWVGNIIYNLSLDFPRSVIRKRYYRDITSGFRRYSNRAMALLLSKKLESKTFDFLIESTMYIYKNRLTISEVPITYSFSNSSLNLRVVKDCIRMCLRIISNKVYH